MTLQRKTPLTRKKRLRAKPSASRKRRSPPVLASPREAEGGSSNEERYLQFIREKPCCVCGQPGPSDPHHIAPRGQKGMGMKVSDYHTVPLCRQHHDAWHRNGIVEIATAFSPSMDRFWRRNDFLIEQASLMREWLEGPAYDR